MKAAVAQSSGEKSRTFVFYSTCLQGIIPICADSNVKRTEIIVEEIPVQFVPVQTLITYKEILAGNAEEAAADIRNSPYLFDENKNETSHLLGDESSILFALSRMELRILRVFLTTDESEKANAFRKALRSRTR